MSINSPTARRWRRRVGAPLLIVVALLGGLIIVNVAGAVKATGHFELDGNATNAAAVAGDDWDNVCFTATANATLCGTNVPVASTNTATSWGDDGALNGTIFSGGGSKDPQPISSWAWKDESGGLPDKDNLLHAFAARYSLDKSETNCPAPATAAKCEVLFFGSDRYDNSGDAVQGFWFLQNQVGLGTNKVGGATGFTGSHRDGDLLVISDFSNGGSTATIRILKWDSTCTGSGGGCETANLRLLIEADNARCSSGAVPNTTPFCGEVNTDNTTPSPWPFVDKSGNNKVYLQGEFFEAGVNLSDPSLNLGDRCFASLVAETRSSTSATATLKDFVVRNFGNCGAVVTTTPKAGDGTTTVSTSNGLSIGTGSVQAKDSATLAVTGINNWSGTMSFFLCGPTATTSTALCEEGGTQIGTAIPVTNATNPPIVSAAATITSVGRYCWRGFFDSATDGLPDAVDARASECFVVNPVTPTLSTRTVDANGANMAASVPFGTALYDKATLSGTANKPGSPVINPTTAGDAAGGTITFKLYGPDSCTTLATNFPSAGLSVNVTNGDGSYTTSTGFTPTAPGVYYWKAKYNGDAPNTNESLVHNDDCSDTNERVTVLQLNPSISTEQKFVPNDAATISVANDTAGNLAGRVIFKLYVGDATCAGTPDYETPAPGIDISTGTGSGTSRTVTSANTRAYTSDASFKWVVVFTSSNPAHTGVTSACGKEISSLTINNDAS
jgi:hypothetical protein